MKTDKPKHWNRCDHCGRFIALKDFKKGWARCKLETPSSHFTAETYETLCKKHAQSS